MNADPLQGLEKVTLVFDCPLPPWLVGIVAAAVVVAVAVLVRRDASHLRRGLRYPILALVIVAALMLTGLVLGPKFIRTWPDPQKPRCAVLVDGSRSMLLTDAYSGEQESWLDERLTKEEKNQNPTPEEANKVVREKVAQLLLDRSGNKWLAALQKDFEVSGWRFGTKMEGLLLDADSPPFEVDPEGYSTELGEAMEEAASGSGGRRSRAIVIITDGAWNSGPDPSEVARVLGRLGIPVFAVGIGDPEPRRDVAVLNFAVPKSVLMGDEVLLTAQIAATGMGARRLLVQLACNGEVIEEKQVLALPSGQPTNVNFSYLPDEPTLQHLEVRVAKQEDEEDDSNNKATAAVEVVERKINVLLIEGEPRWEFRFIRNVLERDRATSLSVCLMRPGIGPIKGPGYVHVLPTKKREMAAYDLIILGDVARRSLPDAFLEELAEMIKRRSGALIVVAGRRRHYAGLAGTPIAEILPVKLDGPFDGGGRSGVPFKMELTRTGASHLITRLSANSEENELEWQGLPAVTWAAGVSGVARGADSLLVHPYRLAGASRLPLLAVHRVGAGKVMFCGIEETWRWRKAIGDKYHYRFWAQAVRWMVKQPFAEGDPRARLSVDRSDCYVGENIEIEVCSLGPDGFPLEKANVWLKVTHADGQSQQLVMEPSPGGWGIYHTTFAPDRPGKFEMRPIVSVYGEEPLSSSATLEVSRADLERNFLAQNRDALQSIAEASGGKYLQIHEVEELATALAAVVENHPLTAEYSPCRNWIYYSVLAVLLGAAWLIRKRSGLA